MNKVRNHPNLCPTRQQENVSLTIHSTLVFTFFRLFDLNYSTTLDNSNFKLKILKNKIIKTCG